VKGATNTYTATLTRLTYTTRLLGEGLACKGVE
jgi:hypothetical protein